MLTPEEFEFNKQRAEAGDSQAAFALYEHYEELGEDQEASKWLLASVSDGFANLDDLPEGTPVSGRERFWLQPAELNANLATAEAGDARSAEALYLHFSLADYNDAQLSKWRLTAASLGSERAQCALAIALMDAQPSELVQARRWAAAAEAAGSRRGRDLLSEIDDRLKRPDIDKRQR
ncbi:hypothetical protein [Trinickia sp.]|uniref:hypothetical protein n=1 Tax=Trinickia sp. TaxID=2571163 RepID=UPI003F7FD30E